jgi:hypothetical protein
MKFTVKRDSMASNPLNFLRRAGYGYIENRRTGQGSFVRRITGNDFPRIHMYVDETPETVTFNLHLDQKQASYKGTHAHAGEYDGSIIEQEMGRLKKLLNLS